MGLFDRLRGLLGGGDAGPPPRQTSFSDAPTSANLPRSSEAEAALADIVEEAIAAGDGWRNKLSASARWQALKNDPAKLQREVLTAAIEERAKGSRSYSGNSWQVRDARRQIAGQLLRRRIEVPAESLRALLDRTASDHLSLEYGDIPAMALLQACENRRDEPGVLAVIRPGLDRLHNKFGARSTQRRLTKFEQGFVDKLAAILDPAAVAAAPAIPTGAFGTFLTAQLALLPAAERAAWEALAGHAAKAGDKSAPTASWCKAAKPFLGAIGTDRFAADLTRWLAEVTPDPAHPDNSLDVLKGFIWLAPEAPGVGLVGPIGRFAETAFRKVKDFGARSVKLGNATLYALSAMIDDPQAGAELFRLRGTIKYPSARALLDRRIDDLAAKGGNSVAELEDAALPDFGLSADGTLSRSFGEVTAELSLTATEIELRWIAAGGKALKSVPAAVSRDHKEAVAALKLLAKDIEKARAGQARRLEDSWLESRSWPLAEWQQHYHAHPVRRQLVQSLIWQAAAESATVAFLPGNGGPQDVSGKPIDLPEDARIALWHPLDADPEAVLAWRARIIELERTQPIKQAHREVYVVTEAELRTETYSNRFAAHILRQHQFRALCQARDWRYDFMGGWDSWNVPTRTLPALGLRVEYAVEPVEDGQRSEAYVPLYIATDQVRFVRSADGAVLPLIDVGRVVFSELMRDVDLFVAVASVAADPTWRDGGPDGRFGTYWREWSFGDLGQSAETRKALIAGIAPRLSIADKLEIGEKALIVTGKRHRYAIHFGSSNIQILPENRYLCIVPDRSPLEADKIRLPFAGDGQLSTILAKAFLLVDESKIRDDTILRQL